MERANAIELEKHLKRTTISANIFSIIFAVVTALVVCFSFYYNTNNTLNTHTQEIKDVKTDVKDVCNEITNAKIYQSANAEQVKSIQAQYTELKQGQLRIEDKLDRIIGKIGL